MPRNEETQLWVVAGIRKKTLLRNRILFVCQLNIDYHLKESRQV